MWWATRRMTILTRPLRTLMFREWHMARILLMTPIRVVCPLRTARTPPGLMEFLISRALIPTRLLLVIPSGMCPEIRQATGPTMLLLPGVLELVLGARTTR